MARFPNSFSDSRADSVQGRLAAVPSRSNDRRVRSRTSKTPPPHTLRIRSLRLIDIAGLDEGLHLTSLMRSAPHTVQRRCSKSHMCGLLGIRPPYQVIFHSNPILLPAQPRHSRKTIIACRIWGKSIHWLTDHDGSEDCISVTSLRSPLGYDDSMHTHFLRPWYSFHRLLPHTAIVRLCYAIPMGLIVATSGSVKSSHP